ncbi:MAG: hypothetical protein K2H44_01065 [Muribaculaceae bacterium]|nr:hypothetical protein [Muribaculaceae bacterium]
MADTKIAGIMRAGAYSPNHIGSDTAIMNTVAENLRKRGFEVNIYTEEQLIDGKVDENIILNMCRERESVSILQRKEDNGDLVINSGYGIENCIRERMARIFAANNIPYPDSIIVNTDEIIRDKMKDNGFEKVWIKRGDFHSIHNEDVTFAGDAAAAQELLQEYFLRGIERAVINQHIEGELIKFYGILDGEFFNWHYIFKDNTSESTISSKSEVKLDIEKLKEICDNAASVLDVKIYGGECVVSPTGEITIIDFNDWPSFSTCRSDAALQITRFVMSQVKEYKQGQSK